MAMAIFAAVATGLAGVLTRRSPPDRTRTSEPTPSRSRTISSSASDRSRTPVGLTVNGNPSGIVNASGNQSANGGPTCLPGYTVTINIAWVDDPNPTSPATRANYKNVIVTVSRARDAKQIYPAEHSDRAAAAGAVRRHQQGHRDREGAGLLTNAPVPDVVVALINGPSSPLGDTTDAGGLLRFPALDSDHGVDLTTTSRSPVQRVHPAARPSVTHFQIAAAAETPVEGAWDLQARHPDRQLQR